MRTVRNEILLVMAAAILTPVMMLATQAVSDRDFRVSVENPVYGDGQGPVVCVDEGHANLHTIDNLFWAFGELVSRDGYVVRGTRSAFDQALLAQCGILVIANAQSPVSASSPSQATAFTNEEVVATSRWVRGGRLLLIADHMPLAAAAANLAAAFDVTFNDGFAVERPAFKAL